MNQKLYKNYVDDITHYLKQSKSNNIIKGFSHDRLNEKLFLLLKCFGRIKQKMKRILEALVV